MQILGRLLEGFFVPVNAIARRLRPQSSAPSTEEVAAKREELLALVRDQITERRGDIRAAYDKETRKPAHDRT